MDENTVLVIDDSPTILKVVQLVLTKAGYKVITAPDGEAGIELARKSIPDLILLDFVMPKMNGYQVCRELSDDQDLSDVPVVLMSAKGDQVGERFVKVMGIVDYITKPFSPEAITAVVGHTIKKYGEEGGEEPPKAEAEMATDSEGPESLAEAADAAHEVRCAALAQLRDSVSRAVAAGILSHPDLVDRELDAAVLTEAARDALDNSTLEAFLGELRASCPELAETGSPGLTGDVRVVPIAEILYLLQTQLQSGVLTVTRGGAKIELYFKEGTVEVATAAGVPEEFLLGRFIVENRLLSQDDLDAFLAERKPSGGLLGTQLVKQGLLTSTELKQVMARQTSELVYELLRWNFGRFTFRASTEQPAIAMEASLGLSVDSILMEGFRRVDEWHLIEREISDFDQIFLRDDEAVRQMGPHRLTREEQTVLELVNGKNTVKDIIRQSRMGSFEVSKMLYRLLSIKLIRKRVAPVAV
jgi:DNA-binding response OmpR family regulator